MRFLLTCTFLTALFTSAAWAAEKGAVIFIVNEKNPVKELSAKEISDFYFKKNRHWPDGSKVRFFDQRGASPQEEWFLKNILKKSQHEVDLFWVGEKNHSGQGAPIVAPSDDMVISSVAAVPGGIGYIYDQNGDLSHVKKITVKGSE